MRAKRPSHFEIFIPAGGLGHRMSGRVLSVLLFVALAPRADAGTIHGTEIERVLREVSAAQQQVQTLQADFRQEKSMSLLAGSDVSTGTFLFSRPDRVLWDYREPRKLEMLISEGWLTTYYPELGKAERVEVRRFEERVLRYLGAAAGAIDDLDRYFDFQLIDAEASPTWALELTPKSSRVAKRVRRIKVWIDRESYLTTALEYEEGDGDLTSWQFSDIRVNEPISDSRFQLRVPSDVPIDTLSLSSGK